MTEYEGHMFRVATYLSHCEQPCQAPLVVGESRDTNRAFLLTFK